jgi:benzil reductase ((S)-benzoin forming)
MNYYYITGTGNGIGKALALLLLENENNYVIGLSRNNAIKHAHFEFIRIDLSDFSQLESFQFIDINDADKISLINNAGLIGEIKHIGNLDNKLIYQTFMVNTVSPAVLMNNFINAYSRVAVEKVILNVSSGAGRHAVEAWSTYCASKSAVDMLSLVAGTEQNLPKVKYPVKIFSVAPGVVDTQMQTQIRASTEDDFSDVGRFIDYKNNNELATPEKAAGLLNKILQNPDKFNDVLLDVRKV